MKDLPSFLLFITIALSCLDASSATAQEAASSDGFRHFTNRNLVGGNYRASRPGVLNLEKCRKACKAISKCKAFSYRKDNKVCYLKKEITRFEERSSAITGILSSITPPPPPPCSAEANQIAEDANTQQAYRTFLQKCKTGSRAARARKIVKQFQEVMAWKRALLTNTCQAYSQFIENHPSRSGPYAALASRNKRQQCRIEQQANERRAFEQAKQLNSCASYSRFLNKYPSPTSPYFHQATTKKQQRCAELLQEKYRQKWEAASSVDSCSSYLNFLQNYPAYDNPYRDQALGKKTYECDVFPPSWCSKAKKPSERAICNSSLLAALDRELNNLYTSARGNYAASSATSIRNAQRSWLKKRNTCGRKVLCLQRRYLEQISFLRQYQR